jgi:MFS transporter, FSR family, fosmidomycin resistance protein
MLAVFWRWATRPIMRVVWLLLLIEVLDEVIDGAGTAALPLMRNDLNLSYWQIGLLGTIPMIVGNILEPILALWSDMGGRKRFIIIGGVGMALSMLLISVSENFIMLLLAQVLFNPSSGAFVSLSQVALMASDPARHEQNMARWTFAGSLGVMCGALLLSASLATGFGWRVPFLLIGVVAAVLTLLVWRARISDAPAPADDEDDDEPDGAGMTWAENLRGVWVALQRREVWRWLILLQASELMLGFMGVYLALYFVDVVGMDEGGAAFGVTVWVGVGLIGDFLLIPLLERVRGVDYLRWSVRITLVAFPLFLLIPHIPLKLALIGLIGLLNAGWYAILKGQLYSAMPGRGGAVLALYNLSNMISVGLPLLIGIAATQFGLAAVMWGFVLGPLALLFGLPRASAAQEVATTHADE